MNKISYYSLIITFLLATSLSYSQTVYVTKSGKKYHKSSCRHLSKSKIEIELKKAADKGYSACKTCKPFSIAKTKKSSIKKSYTKSKSTSSRCQATTKKGTRCKRKSKAGSSYCWQHN